MTYLTGPAPALPVPDIAYTPDGPRSLRFDDGYHGAADGLAEAAHVFVDGNDLPARFARLRAGEVFVLGELGFGTGTNALAALRAWADRGHAAGHLWIVSAEGYPLSRAQMARSLGEAASRWSSVAEAAARLGAAYPDPLPGQATVRLGDDATLTLLFGEAADALAGAGFAADAWMLDGFSPRTNPEMWTDELMALVAARSRAGATAATFTVAGAVRRALAAAGFAWAKRAGFGRKRECLRARLPGEAPRRAAPRVGVLGAGIAGASLAEALRRLGVEAVLFDPAPASGASGNPGGLVTPRLQAADDPIGRFYRDAYLYARRTYAAACPGALETHGASVVMAARRVEKVLALGLWPEGELIRTEAGFDAPGGAVLAPARAVASLRAGTETVRRAPMIERTPDGFSLDGEAFGAVVIAAGSAAPFLLGERLRAAFSARRGQIDLFAGAAPRVLSGDGYAAPLGQATLAGATYGAAAFGEAASVTADDTAANAETAARLLGRAPGPHRGGRAALRLAARDRHPVVGGVPEGPHLLTALGSRGLVTAPLLAADLASALAGAPRPLPRDQQIVLSPTRFLESSRLLGEGMSGRRRSDTERPPGPGGDAAR